MLPLTTSDWDPLADVVHRCNDHEKRARTATTDGSSLLHLAADLQPDIQLVGMWEENQLVGALAPVEGADASGWTEGERAEQSWLARLAFTDPDLNRLGRLATLWLGDCAARQNTPTAVDPLCRPRPRGRLVPGTPVWVGSRAGGTRQGRLPELPAAEGPRTDRALRPARHDGGRTCH